MGGSTVNDQSAANDPRWATKAHGYAAKFAAETVSYEPPQWVEPTDEAFVACFAHCVRVPPASVYPLIRESFLAEYGAFRDNLTVKEP